MKFLKFSTFAAASLLAAAPAAAHTGHDHTSGLVAGFVHPFLGADHLLAMVTVGLLAATYGLRRGLVLPLGFVGGMIVGATAGFGGIDLPAVEFVVAASLVLLGAAMVGRAWLPLSAVAALTFAAGLFHGHAHAAEATGSALAYVAGFVVATAVLHAAGGLAGLKLAAWRLAAPIAGGAVALAGLGMLAG